MGNNGIRIGNGLDTPVWTQLMAGLPFVGECVKFSVELTHSDGLGVEDVGVHDLKWRP